MLLSNIYNRVGHKFYNLYEVLPSIIQTKGLAESMTDNKCISIYNIEKKMITNK